MKSKRPSEPSLAEIERRIISCARCPELRAYAAEVARTRKRMYSDQAYWGKPVPAFGDPAARVMLVGLAPGAHGSNRTGRMFTGDASGDFLYPALHRAGFASRNLATGRDDGLVLDGCFITAAARCAPPKNKPTPAELRRCLPFLAEEFDALPALRAIVGLGSIGFDAALKVMRSRGFEFGAARPAFGHAAQYRGSNGVREIVLLGCYHPSRQNTNTGRLTAHMLDSVLAEAAAIAATGYG